MAATREHGGFGTGPQDDAARRSGHSCADAEAFIGAADRLDDEDVEGRNCDFGDGVDDGPQPAGKKGHLPERRCLVSGARRPISSLIRFVRGPNGEVVPDLAAKLPGRGLGVSADRAIVNTAVKRNLFSRAARARSKADPDLAAVVEAGLAARVADLISLARRAGEAVAGFEKSKSALNSGGAAVLIAASDSAEDGREKLSRLAGALDRNGRRKDEAGGAGEIAELSVLSASELGGAFGRERVIHAVVMQGGLAARIRMEAARLTGFRPGVG